MAAVKPHVSSFRIITVRMSKEGGVVFNPSTARRLEFGKSYKVPAAPYWMRRIKDGALELCNDKGDEIKRSDDLPKVGSADSQAGSKTVSSGKKSSSK